MPVTHDNGASEFGSNVASFVWNRPTRVELDRAKPDEGTVLGDALLRIRSCEVTGAGFDNRL